MFRRLLCLFGVHKYEWREISYSRHPFVQVTAKVCIYCGRGMKDLAR